MILRYSRQLITGAAFPITVLMLALIFATLPASAEEKVINFVTSAFPEITATGLLPKVSDNKTAPSLSEDNTECPLSNWTAPPPEILAVLCISPSPDRAHEIELAQNLAFFTHSQLNARFRFLVVTTGMKTRYLLDDPTNSSGPLRTAIFSIEEERGEAFIDSLIDISEKISSMPMPKVVIYYGPARDSRINGKALSGKTMADLDQTLKSSSTPLFILETTGKPLGEEFRKAVSSTGGKVLGSDSQSVKDLASQLDSLSSRMFFLKYTSPDKSRNGLRRNVTLSLGKLSIEGFYYPPADALAGSNRLVITTLDGNDRPYPGHYEIRKDENLLSSGKINQDGLLVIQGVHGKYSITMTDGIHSISKTLEVEAGRDAHALFRFNFGTLQLEGKDQYGNSIDMEYWISPAPENSETPSEISVKGNQIHGRTATKSSIPIELLPGKYLVRCQTSDDSREQIIEITGGKTSSCISYFQKKNFTIGANDLNSIPVDASYLISNRNSGQEVSRSTLGDDGLETINLSPGKYKILFTYQEKAIERNFEIKSGEISGVTVKFPLYPVKLITTQKNRAPVVAEFLATNTETLKNCAMGKTNEQGLALIHLEKGNYKFVFSFGDAVIEKFEQISLRKMHELKANFSEATLRIHILDHESRPMEGWYQIVSTDGREKLASGTIDRGGSKVKLEPDTYRITVKPDIMSPYSMDKEFTIEPSGLELPFNFSSALSLSWRGPADKSIDKCWYEIFDCSERKETKLQEGRVFEQGREFKMAPGEYRVVMKPSPFTLFEHSEKISLKPEDSARVESDFSCVLQLNSKILDRPETPYYRIYTPDGKTELARGMVENGTARVSLPPGTYLIRLTPFLKSLEKHDETLQLDSGKTLTVSADFTMNAKK